MAGARPIDTAAGCPRIPRLRFGRMLTRAVAAALPVLAAGALTAVATASASTATASAGTVARAPAADTPGAMLYRRDCASCHGPQGEGSPRGTPLAGTGAAGADFMLATGRMPLVTDEVRRRPTYDEKERAALVDYVSSLAPGPDVPELDLPGADLGRGGTLYRAHCARCHGTTGAGTALAFGALAPPIGDVPPVQLAESAIVGPGAMPVLSPAVLSDGDLNDLVAYVRAVAREHATPPREMGGGRLGEAVVGLGVGLAALVLAATALAKHR